MKFARFLLEEWFNEHYFDTELVLCESGVEAFSLGEIRKLTHIEYEDLDQIVFRDAPSYGSLGLREAIAQRWRNGDIDQVMITHGSSEGLFLVMSALLHPDDEVIVLTPCYQPFLSIPEALGCTVKSWKLRPEQQFIPHLEDLKQLLSPRTRMVVVNFPNNPTGATLTIEQQEMLVAMVAETNAYLLWDSAFVELSYDTRPLPDPWISYERTVTLGTLTKAYGLSGMRIGWCLASPSVLEQCVHIREYTTLNLSPLTQFIAQRIIEHIEAFLSIRLQQACTNLELLAEWVEAHKTQVGWVRPKGGVSAFLRLYGISDVEAFCARLVRSHGVFLLPGRCFGYPSYLRIGFGASTAEFKEGLSRLSSLLNSI